MAALAVGGAFFTQRGAFAQGLTLTPAQMEGPYYPNVLPLDLDNDLILINEGTTPAVGTIAWLTGRALDRNGQPVRNALVEIWQADNVGSYIHTQGALSGQRDSNFQGYGRFQTASDGACLFRTIKPGLYRTRPLCACQNQATRRTDTDHATVHRRRDSNNVVLNDITNTAWRTSVIRPWTAISGSAIGALAVNWGAVMGFTPAGSCCPVTLARDYGKRKNR